LNIGRRGFLQLLAASGAALAVPDTGGWRFLTQETPTFAPFDALRVPVVRDLSTLVRAVTATLGNLQLTANRKPFLLAGDGEFKMGDDVAGYQLTDQISIQPDRFTLMDLGQPDIQARMVEPMAAALFSRIQYDGAAVFAPLRIPKSVEQGVVCRDPKAGMAVRGLYDYDILTDQYILRLDMLYGRAQGLPS
jgi:hypothetical protein